MASVSRRPAPLRERSSAATPPSSALMRSSSDALRRVHDAGVDVADLGQREQVGGVLGVAEVVAGGLVDRQGAGAGRRVGPWPAWICLVSKPQLSLMCSPSDHGGETVGCGCAARSRSVGRTWATAGKADSDGGRPVRLLRTGLRQESGRLSAFGAGAGRRQSWLATRRRSTNLRLTSSNRSVMAGRLSVDHRTAGPVSGSPRIRRSDLAGIRSRGAPAARRARAPRRTGATAACR